MDDIERKTEILLRQTKLGWFIPEQAKIATVLSSYVTTLGNEQQLVIEQEDNSENQGYNSSFTLGKAAAVSTYVIMYY